MKSSDKVHGSAMFGENDFERKYMTGIERMPKTKGMTRRSLSGFVNGYRRWVRTKKRGG
jgi:hypothetical protein